MAEAPSMAGKYVLVTGGTGGIGKATAAGLAALGAQVGITGRDLARAAAAAADIRAATRVGRPEAQRWLDERSASAAASEAPWARGPASPTAVPCSRARLRRPSRCSRRRSPSTHGGSARSSGPRTELAYGASLRRQRRRVGAREHLRAALETFDVLGCNAVVEPARSELRASGETARARREQLASAELTRQELQVAKFVSQGLSNREVGAQLFLSPRTVDFHLRNVFTKMGISSRTELAALRLETDAPSRSSASA